METYHVYTLSTPYDMKQLIVHEDTHSEPDFKPEDYLSTFGADMEITKDGTIEIDMGTCHVPEVMYG